MDDKGSVVKTVESEAQSDAPPLRKLVVRVKIPVEDPPPAPERPPLNRVALSIAAVAVAAVLTWLGVSMFRSEKTAAPAVTEAPPISQPPAATPAPVQAAPVVEDEPPPEPVEVIPDVSPGAQQTIRGTIRVSIRAIVDKDGNVVAATADETGPSRYFARISLEAARKWTFPPSESAEQRVMLVRFYFKRTGTTARAISAP